MELKFTGSKFWHELWNVFLVVIGTAILAFGTGIFLVPFDLVTGGISGISIVLEKVLPFPIGIDFYIAVITWLLFFLGLITLGRSFALKTLVSTIVYPPVLSLSLKLVDPDVLGGFFYLEGSAYQDISILLAAIFGAICVGAGCAVTFLGGGSTGGTDILAFMICKVFKRLKSSVVIFVVDALVVILGMFAINDLVISLLGISSAFICALVVDYIFLGNSKAFVAQIISNQYAEINQEVIRRLERTTTIWDAEGGYSGLPRKVVMVSFTMSQYSELLNIIHQVDRNAFVTISSAHEINGEGWTSNSDGTSL
ncbi:MAG: YitT family protein [Oscillospiraceae bacterium]|nr:YitT family protein [Oscillospiraceae bacterium]